MGTEDTEVIQSSQKLFSVLEQVITQRGAGVTEIADETSLAKSTIHLHLQSLLENGYVVKRGERYHPSLRIFKLGEDVRNGVEIYHRGREEIDNLVGKTPGIAKLGVLEDNEVRVVHVNKTTGEDFESSVVSISTEFSAESSQVIKQRREYRDLLGKVIDIHATAIGKALLAEMPRELIDSIVEERGLTARTENTITDKSALFDELEEIRNQGYAEDIEEATEGLCCVGTSISEGGRPIGGVSVSVSADRMDGDTNEELSRKILNTANMIEVKLNHSEYER